MAETCYHLLMRARLRQHPASPHEVPYIDLIRRCGKHQTPGRHQQDIFDRRLVLHLKDTPPHTHVPKTHGVIERSGCPQICACWTHTSRSCIVRVPLEGTDAFTQRHVPPLY
eukprot:scaffold2699_cov376-Prasinococcus_capsulatus_cf.AAC.4